jgi:uncharacterized protein YqhQ
LNCPTFGIPSAEDMIKNKWMMGTYTWAICHTRRLLRGFHYHKSHHMDCRSWKWISQLVGFEPTRNTILGVWCSTFTTIILLWLYFAIKTYTYSWYVYVKIYKWYMNSKNGT